MFKNMFKIGFFGGKMLPVHLGHLYCISCALKMCEELHVILFHSSNLEKDLIAKSIFPKKLLSPEVRKLVLERELKQYSNVFIHTIDSEKCISYDKMMNNTEHKNIEFVSEIIGKYPDIVFSSEPKYDMFLKNIYPQARHVIIDKDRKMFDISGSLIRTENIEKYKKFLPESYKIFLL